VNRIVHRAGRRPQNPRCLPVLKKIFPCLLFLLLSKWMPAQDALPVVPLAIDNGAFFLEVITQSLAFSHRDLDGALVLGNADQVFYVPRVRFGLGFGVGFGRRLRSGMWSVSYSASGHDVTFQERNGSATMNLVQFNARTFLLKTQALKVFAHFGLNFPWLTVYDDSADRYGKVFDATYLGLGFNAGAGVQVPVSDRMFFSASILYRYIGFLYARGPQAGIDVTDLFEDRSGPRHPYFLRAPAWALELSLGYVI
jgi:opacity protein-like surface antigen